MRLFADKSLKTTRKNNAIRGTEDEENIFWFKCSGTVKTETNVLQPGGLPREAGDLQVYHAGAVAQFNWNLSGQVVRGEIPARIKERKI